MIKQVKMYTHSCGDCYDVNGLVDSQVRDLIKELDKIYYTVDTWHFGTYLSNNKCFGYIRCTNKIK